MPAVGDSIRSWREQRRLSQLELAIRAGTTQRHLSFVERGRSAPGRTLLLRLSESLELSLRERNQLLLDGGFAPVFPETSFDDEALRPIRCAIQQVLDGHLPCPAVVTDQRGYLVASNDASDVLTEGVDPDLLVPPVHALRVALHPRGMAPRIANIGQWGHRIVDSLRYCIDRQPDPAVDELLAELLHYVAGQPVDHPEPHLSFVVPLRLRSHDGELRLITTLTTFVAVTDVTFAELHLEAFLPADGQTAEALTRREQRRRGRCIE